MNDKPTIGRIVHFNDYGIHKAAIVTRVVDAHAVDLTVFAPGEPPCCEMYVCYHSGPDYPSSTWHWPERE